MLTKEIFNIIEETIEQLLEENNGDLPLIPNMDKIVRRAEVTMDELYEYFERILLG